MAEQVNCGAFAQDPPLTEQQKLLEETHKRSMACQANRADEPKPNAKVGRQS